MKHDKLLAEWFWIDRWMGSSGFLLPLEARGLYREMLTQAWRRGARLPNDHEAIRRATGTTNAEWRRTWPKVERFWRVDGDSLINDTQLEVYRTTIGLSLTRAVVGSKGGANRVANRQAKEQANRQANEVAKLKPPSPSPSPTDNGPISQARANPFVTGRRDDLEREAQALSREIGDMTDQDPGEVFANAAHYEGARRQKVNPANLTDDRLLNTVLDLRATLRDEQAKRPRPTA